MDKNAILQHLRYSFWATGETLAACRDLSDEELRRDFGGSFGSLFSTLVHLYGADAIWFSRWQVQPLTAFPQAADFNGLSDLEIAWRALHGRIELFVAGLEEHDLHKRLPMTNMRGEGFTHSYLEMMLHLVNHNAYHRGQVTHMLRVLGHKAPATDLIRYYRLT